MTTPSAMTRSSRQLSTLLHEVRNPLTALNTLAKLLQKRLPPEDRNHWIGLSIEQECKHLQDLLLEFERSDGIPAPLQVQPLSLGNLLREWIPVYQAVAETQGHHFQAEIPSHLPLIQVDPRALRQILDNLIDNACKYTPSPGQIQLRVELQPDTAPTMVEVSICDSGPGIHPENLERIFAPFFRADPSKPGQGLGLAISRDLATQMGGRLEVESSTQGSCFHLSLPLA
ncbi:sensor histidine kinase [Synechococcus sp. Nb3U1]|uniref:sensor histidine kinase n=1 Tax=Synechococcus sp. Nb3U1 TaxID=1914529 RepID=UPI001F178F96|nr:HAMP domain-containing sensor histidine kinase [Synechococcus sp. Nb3U1]